MAKKSKHKNKQKQYCIKFNKDFKNGPHQKYPKKKKRKKKLQTRIPSKNVNESYKCCILQTLTKDGTKAYMLVQKHICYTSSSISTLKSRENNYGRQGVY